MPHPHDVSVQTFRGHSVLQTLIRAYFSPAHSTGQRFVYTGSADGTPRIFGAPGCCTLLLVLQKESLQSSPILLLQGAQHVA